MCKLLIFTSKGSNACVACLGKFQVVRCTVAVLDSEKAFALSHRTMLIIPQYLIVLTVLPYEWLLCPSMKIFKNYMINKNNLGTSEIQEEVV